jgi:outer membrane protein OmpA-like peptidoglycan-associated protein
MYRVFAYIVFFSTYFEPALAQLVISNTMAVNDLVTKVLVGNNCNLLIDSIDFTGSPESIGSFNYKLEHNNLISKGIILSTGKINDAIGPNNVPNKGNESYKISTGGDLDLSRIAYGETFDAAILEFDFMSSTDSISFNFFFASEEYPEYVKKNVNDVFGFFLIDKELGTKINIAVIPDTETPISIDNINSLTNNDYFIENAIWDTEKLDFFTNYLDLAELAYTLQFDGLTVPIHVGARVKSHKPSTLKLAIADVGDDIFDTALFFESESFKSSGKSSKTLPIDLLTEFFTDQIIDLYDSLLVLNYNIAFGFDSVTFSGEESYSFLLAIYTILKYDKNIYLEIQGFTDNVGTSEYNLLLSEKRAKNVRDYLILKGLESERVKSVGFGNTKPLSTSNKELNRRVEFVLYKKYL